MLYIKAELKVPIISCFWIGRNRSFTQHMWWPYRGCNHFPNVTSNWLSQALLKDVSLARHYPMLGSLGCLSSDYKTSKGKWDFKATSHLSDSVQTPSFFWCTVTARAVPHHCKPKPALPYLFPLYLFKATFISFNVNWASNVYVNSNYLYGNKQHQFNNELV